MDFGMEDCMLLWIKVSAKLVIVELLKSVPANPGPFSACFKPGKPIHLISIIVETCMLCEGQHRLVSKTLFFNYRLGYPRMDLQHAHTERES